MLTPAQVIPFLSHDDPEVRRRARLYLTSAHDPAPATADDFWAAADKAPPEEAGAYLDRLGLVPQTENSLRRLLDELPKADPATADSLRRTLERVEFDLLRQHVDTIRASTAVPEALTQHLQARLDLANEPVEPLWDRMLAFGRGLGDRNLTEAEELEADRLIEAVARHPDAFRERVVAALRDPELTAWAELLVTDIAGQMKLTDAVGPLLDKLKAEDAELLWEVAGDALVHIGDEGVVRQIAERWPAEDAGFRISATGILGRIKRPESQAVLLERLQAEADPDMVSTLVAAVADLIPDDEPTFATLRGIARDGNYDRTDIRLDEELLTLAAMNGLPLPEAGQWRERMEQGRSRWAMGMSNVDQLLQPAGSLGPATLHTPPLRPMGGGGIGGGGAAARRGGSAAAIAERPKAAPAATGRQPFRNAQAKVGRNDPCTCGSGKKFKKCCGK